MWKKVHLEVEGNGLQGLCEVGDGLWWQNVEPEKCGRKHLEEDQEGGNQTNAWGETE